MLMRRAFLAVNHRETIFRGEGGGTRDKKAIFINISSFYSMVYRVWPQPDSYKNCELYISL